jgi:putative DNA primase/helicase
MTLTELRDRFALPHRPDGQGGWFVRCPSHADCTKNNNPSLHLSARADGGLLAHCFAKCDTDTVLAAKGLTTRDLMPPKMPPKDDLESRILAVYPYVDATGILLYQVLRLAPKDFRQRRPDPAHPGRWIWNLDGVRKVLYRLPEVRQAAATSPLGPGWIAVVEGEKDADRLWSIEIPATTNAGGAAARWLDEYFEQLHPYVTGLVIFPDLDPPGRKHAREIIRRGLAFGGFQFKYLELPGLPAKGDVSDWLA